VGNETANRAGLLRRLGAAVGSGAAGVLLVTGCAAGQQAQTVEQTPSIDGVQAEAGNIAIRAAGIAAPESGASYSKGSDAPLRMVLINRGGAADKLVSVTSTMAGGVQITPGSSSSPGASGSGQPSNSASDSSAASGSPSASAGSSSPAASTTASAPATGSSNASQNTPIELAGRQSVRIGIGSGGPSVTLTGLTTELFPSQPVPVTLTFSSGASVTVVVAVQLTSEVPSAPVVSEATVPPGE
jgi:hypothetical protein